MTPVFFGRLFSAAFVLVRIRPCCVTVIVALGQPCKLGDQIAMRGKLGMVFCLFFFGLKSGESVT
jgi:hypothetical protein